MLVVTNECLTLARQHSNHRNPTFLKDLSAIPTHLSLYYTMQGAERREIEWAPPKESPPVLLAAENPPEEYGPWQWAAALGRATGLICAEAFKFSSVL